MLTPRDAPCNLSVESSQCTLQTCCISQQGQIPYIPNLPANIILAAIFGLLLAIQLLLGVKFKTWSFLVWMSLGLIGEIVGYIGRIMLHYNDFDFNAFLIYLIPLTIAPAFLTASIYLCLARIIIIYDPSQTSSRLKPLTYTKIFVSFDIISLILQAAGGAVAAIATTKSTSNIGVDVMIAGLAFQVVSLLIFIGLCTDFWLRYRKNGRYSSINVDDNLKASVNTTARIRNSAKFRGFIYALIAATFLILVRSVYRLAELQGGFQGKIAGNETLFMILEGPCIILAVGGLSVFHPGVAVGRCWGTLLDDWKKGAGRGDMLLAGKAGFRDRESDTEYSGAYGGSEQDLPLRENGS